MALLLWFCLGVTPSTGFSVTTNATDFAHALLLAAGEEIESAFVVWKAFGKVSVELKEEGQVRRANLASAE